MPTQTPLTDQINALTTYANTVTGQSDTCLSDAVATLADGYGGGGGSSPFVLLDTITADSDVRGLLVDFTQYADYDAVFVFENITLSASDWLYYTENSSTPSGGSYTPGSSVTHKGICAWTANIPTGQRKSGKIGNTTLNPVNNLTSMLIYTYTASKTILAGSYVKVYGFNYSDI